MKGVYVAASSNEIPRAKHWMERLRLAGVEVTSTWPQLIESVGDSNPRDATEKDRLYWAVSDLAQVMTASHFWLLSPIDGPGRGSYFEAGVAYVAGKSMIASGDYLQSIFTSKMKVFATDEEAFAYLVARFTGEEL